MITIDFESLRSGKVRMADAVRDIKLDDLRKDTEELFTNIDAALEGMDDAAATFVPHDPQGSEGDERGWPISHIVPHLTATLEEGAATAAALARGVAVEQRLRYEVPWETLTSAEQVYARLRESRRMCLAFLDAWPDEPHLDLTITRIPPLGPMNAVATYVLSLLHGNGHLDQLRETLRQAKG